MSIYAQMMSCAVRYGVIYRPLPINSQYLETWGADSPASSVHERAWLASIAFEFSGFNR